MNDNVDSVVRPRPRKCWKCSANVFITGIERSQRVRLQRDMWKLCDENRRLGGKHWRTVLKRFGLKESEVWPNAPHHPSGCSGAEPR